MKSVLVPFTAALFGALVAMLVGEHYLREFASSQIQRMEDEQRYRCVLSMAVLDRLETNEPDRAKLLLTREVVSYYKHPLGLPESAERKKILEHIDTLRAKSSALNEALAKEAR